MSEVGASRAGERDPVLLSVTDGLFFLLGGGVAWELAAPWKVDAGLRARVAKLAGGATVDYPAIFQLGLSTRFDLAGE